MKILNSDKRRGVIGWVIYDWANSAFATTVMAGFFPIFFKNYWSHGTDVNVSTAQLGFGNALGGLIVALLGPILGAIADKGNAKKKFLTFFAYLGVAMTAGLYFVHLGEWQWAIFLYVVAIVGFSGGNIFYDALLPQVADEKNIDFISGLGFALGYLGGGLLFLINVLMTLMPETFGLQDKTSAVRLSFLTVTFWWGTFSLFTIFWINEIKYHENKIQKKSIIIDGLKQFLFTFKKFRYHKTIFFFLLAYWLYIDGVDTIIRMAVDYGLSLGFQDTDLIIALLLVQFIGFPAAIVYSKLGQRWNVRGAILIGIIIYMAITIGGMFMNTIREFYILAIAIGLVQGGIQALSRSYYSRLIPKNQAGEFYGFYNMIGKFAVIVGPALMGLVGLMVKNILISDAMSPEEIRVTSQLASRWSIGSILILFLVGGILFYFVDEEKGKKEAQKIENETT